MGKEILSSVSLVPAEADIEAVSPVIKDLAERHVTDPFMPHITIWGNVSAPIDEVEDAVRHAIEGVSPFSVEIESLNHSPRWSKTLFAQLRAHEAMDHIHAKLGERLGSFSSYDFNPHLSLVYKEEMTEEEKQREISQIVIPSQLSIDSVVVTTPTDPELKWRNLPMWSDLIKLSLRG